MLEEAIGFGRMTAGLVDQKGEELWREDQRGRALVRERGVNSGFRVIAVPARARNQVEMLHVLPARLPHESRVVSRGGLSTGFHREDREPGARLDDLLRHVGAFARDETLARAIRGDGRTSSFDVRADRRGIDGAQMIDALGERHGERVAPEFRAVLPALRAD